MPPRSIRQDHQLLEKLAGKQQQVVSRPQLAAAGFDSDAVRRRLRSGRWRAIGRVVVLHNGPSDDLTLQWVGVLSVRGLAAITGRTAARSYGLRGFEPEAIDIVVPHGTRTCEIPGVRWRRSRHLPRIDLSPGRDGSRGRDGLPRRDGPARRDSAAGNYPPTVTASRAVLDAAARTPSAKVACALLVASVQQRVVSVQALRQELADVGPLKRCRLFNAILADIEGGADSLAEIDFTRLARKARLPPPIRQSVRVDSFGRRRYLDIDFGAFVVEVDGGIHLRPLNYWADARRQNELVLGGDRVLRFPTVAIRLDEDVVVEQLARAGRIFGIGGRSTR